MQLRSSVQAGTCFAVRRFVFTQLFRSSPVGCLHRLSMRHHCTLNRLLASRTSVHITSLRCPLKRTQWCRHVKSLPEEDASLQPHHGDGDTASTHGMRPLSNEAAASEEALQDTRNPETSAGSCKPSAVNQLNLPVMPLSKAKLPTDLVSLQLFEPRYRLMFRLLNQKKGRDRLFGVVQSDR